MERFKFLAKEKISRLPKKPGVYCFKKNKEILYIGKAANLRERVKNHFPSRSKGERRTNVLRTQQPAYRDNLFINQVTKIGYIKADSEIEALILEANLIKKYQPKYNVIWKDDKNYFYVGITKEKFPRLFLTHQTKLKPKAYNLKPVYVGPFVDGKALKETLKILRKVFPFRSCKTLPNRPCLWYQLARCPAPCQIQSKLAKEINLEMRLKKECQSNAKNLMKVLQGKKIEVLKNLKREMKEASKIQDFERAAKIRNQIIVLERVLENAKIFEPKLPEINWEKIEEILKNILKTKNEISRIEAYDISNIQGQEATGSMVTFIDGFPDKNFYRRFKIKISGKPNDIAMIKEVLVRRFNHPEWGFPDLILIDGGRAQLNATLNVLNQHKSAKSASISVSALAKKENKLFIKNQKEPIRLDSLPDSFKFAILRLRDEAHRFAISYHKKLREEALFK